MVGVNFDVTERRRTEERLRSFTQELEARVAERTLELTLLHARLRALSTELNLTEQRERKRLATDLHDYLTQLLALVCMKLGQIKRLMPQAAQSEITQTESVVNEALIYTRTLVAQLSPPILQEFGLTMALPWLPSQYSLSVTRNSLLSAYTGDGTYAAIAAPFTCHATFPSGVIPSV